MIKAFAVKLFLLLITLIILAVPALKFSASSVSADSSWNIVPNPATNQLNSVAAISPNDVWAVGHPNGAYNGIVHWNGSTWDIVNGADLGGDTINGLFGISAVSADDVWAVGGRLDVNNSNHPLIEHWDGTKWTAIPNLLSGSLYGVAALSTNDVWVVGEYYPNGSNGQILTEHWDGNEWKILPAATPDGASNPQIQGISGTASNDVWAVGYASVPGNWSTPYNHPLVLHWDGQAWSSSILTTGSGHGNATLSAVSMVSSNNVWAVGTTDDIQTCSVFYGCVLVLHWDGNTWTEIPTPPTATQNGNGLAVGYLNSISAVNAQNVWAVGTYLPEFPNGNSHQPLIEHWDGHAWSIAINPQTGMGNSYLYGINTLSPDSIWVVGMGSNGGQPHGLIEHYSSPIPFSQGDIFAGSNNDKIYHYNQSGTFLDTLNAQAGNGAVTGTCNDALGNLYAVNYFGAGLSKFNNQGTFLSYPWGSHSSGYFTDNCVSDGNDIYVSSQYGWAPSIQILKYSTDGTLLDSYYPAVDGNGGNTYIDLSLDHCTMLYTDGGSTIKSYNVCTKKQNPDFAQNLPSTSCSTPRIRPNGEVLVNCQSNIYRLNTYGAVITTYPITNPSEGFALSLDPDNTHFWVGGFQSGNAYKVNIETGEGFTNPVFTIPVYSGPDHRLWSLAVYGQFTAPPPPTACSVTTSPSAQNLSIGQTASVSASVTSGLGSVSITGMHFGSYNTTLATVNPIDDTTSPYETTVTAIAEGNTSVWATADLSDGRTCQSSGDTDTNVTVTATLVDFKLDSDGYKFSNYDLTANIGFDWWSTLEAEWTAMSSTNNLSGLFPELPSDATILLAKSVILPFMGTQYLSQGYCFGFASTAILYNENPSLKPIQYVNTYDLTMNQAKNNIVDYFYRQYPFQLDTISTDLNGSGNPSTEYQSLSDLLKNQHKPAMLSISAPDPSVKGKRNYHAVVAYNIIDNGNTKTVQIYDNNHPFKLDNPSDSIRNATFDLTTNTFKYKADNDTYDSVQVGDPNQTYLINNLDSIKNAFYAILGWLQSQNFIQIHLHSPVTGLVVDSQGHRIGMVNGSFVNEIPSAQMDNLNDETVFYVPSTSQYTLTTTGTSAATSSSTLGVDVTIPTGGTNTKWLSYTNIPVLSGSTTTLTIGATNTNYVMNLSTGTNKNPDTVDTIDDSAKQIFVAPTTTASLSPTPNPKGWNNSNVTVTLNATTSANNSVKQITYSATGSQAISSTVSNGSSASISITTEGTTTITYFATDAFGDQEAPKTITVKLDKTPPTITCSVNPITLWPPDHTLRPVTAMVNVTDALSDANGFILNTVTSNEPDNGLGDGDLPNDIQGFTAGTASASGQLRAERSGTGTGRIYTLTYTGSDIAGNTASCIATVTVPHDQKSN